MTIQEQIEKLQEQRAALVAKARKVRDTVEARQDGGPTGEETSEIEKIWKEVDALKTKIDELTAMLRVESEEEEMASSTGRSSEPDAGRPRGQGGTRSGAGGEPRTDEIPENVRRRLGDFAGLPELERRALLERCNRQYESSFRRYLLSGERRDLVQGHDPSGGYLAPLNFAAQLIQALDDMVHIRALANVQTVTSGEGLGVPTLDTDMDDANWTSELLTGSADTGTKFGQREWHPHPLAKRVLVSRKLLRSAVIGPEQIVRQRLAYKFAIANENAFLTGSGAGQPLGLFVASADGIPTTRDVSTGNIATDVRFDGLIEAKMAVKAQYRRNARWLFHRTAVRNIAKLKDGNGQYIWQPSQQVDQPDMLLGKPVLESEFAPSTFAASQYVGLFGDFSYYWIVDALAIDVQRLEELYAATNQVGFIARMETDGMPVDANAFARVQLSA